MLLVLGLLTSMLAVLGGPGAGAAATEGSISGIVRGPGGEPLAGVWVGAESNGPPWDWGQSLTGPDGRYVIDGLLPGPYRVGFESEQPDLLFEYYLDAHRYQDAVDVMVTAGGVRADVDATLEEAGSISGTVTGPSGLPLARVSVQVEPASGECCFDTGTAVTSWEGTFHVEGLSADTYVVHLQPGAGSVLAPEFYADQAVFEEATPVLVAQGVDVTGIDAQLTVGATISGTVTGPLGDPLADVEVYATSEPEFYEGFSAEASRLYLSPRRAVTDHLGRYSIVGLAPVEHLVSFDSSDSALVGEWWDDVFASSEATPIALTPAATITGIDAQLTTRGSLAGTVTGLGSGPLADVVVVLYHPDGGWASGVRTNASGAYSFPSLNPGDYVVVFGPDPASGWRPEFFDDAMTRPDAQLVTIVSGVPLTGVDAELQLCAAPAMFTDVPLHQYFCAAIEWLTGTGIAGGFDDGTFRPAAPLTRQAVAAFLHRLTGDAPGPFPNPGFSDVSTASPFFADVAWLVDSGLGGGYADGTFRPTAPVSRQALAAFLYELAGAPDVELWGPPFDDVPVAHPFAVPIEYLTDLSVITGYGDNTFRPGVTVSRQALAAFLFAYVNRGLPTTVP